MLTYLTSLFLNNMIFHMLTTACAWVAYQQSGSPMSLAIVGLMQFIPVLFTFIPAGYISDRFDKRRVVACSGLVTSVICLCLAGWANSRGTQLLPLYICVFIYSMSRSFEATSSATVLPEIVDSKILTRSVARSSATKQVAKVGGPVLAGYLVSFAQVPWLVFSIMALCSAVSAGAILLVKGSTAPKIRTEEKEPGVKKFLAGLRYIHGNKILMGAVGLDVFAGLLGGLAGILPIIATQVLNSDASALGWMRSSIALGSFVASLFLGAIVLNYKIGRYLISSVMLLGLCIASSAFAKDLYTICAILLVFGVLDALSVHIRQNLIQIASPGMVRGRVTSANQLFIVISNQLSDVRAGLSAGMIGLGPTVVLGGVGVFGVAAIWRYLFPQLAELNSFEDAQRN